MPPRKLFPGPGQGALIVQDNFLRREGVAEFVCPEELTEEIQAISEVTPKIQAREGLCVSIKQYHEGLREALESFSAAAQKESFVHAARSPKYAGAIKDRYGEDFPEVVRRAAKKQDRLQQQGRRAFFKAYGRNILYQAGWDLSSTADVIDFMDTFMGYDKKPMRDEVLGKIAVADKVLSS